MTQNIVQRVSPSLDAIRSKPASTDAQLDIILNSRTHQLLAVVSRQHADPPQTAPGKAGLFSCRRSTSERTAAGQTDLPAEISLACLFRISSRNQLSSYSGECYGSFCHRKNANREFDFKAPSDRPNSDPDSICWIGAVKFGRSAHEQVITKKRFCHEFSRLMIHTRHPGADLRLRQLRLAPSRQTRNFHDKSPAEHKARTMSVTPDPEVDVEDSHSFSAKMCPVALEASASVTSQWRTKAKVKNDPERGPNSAST